MKFFCKKCLLIHEKYVFLQTILNEQNGLLNAVRFFNIKAGIAQR